jgi:hypothetical protein
MVDGDPRTSRNFERITITDEGTGRSLSAGIVGAGEDLVVVVGGGQRPHVGCVVLAIPYPSKADPDSWSASSSLLTIPPHKEEPIARGIAERVARASGRLTVVTAGVHDDDLDREGIDCYLRLSERLAERLEHELPKVD